MMLTQVRDVVQNDHRHNIYLAVRWKVLSPFQNDPRYVNFIFYCKMGYFPPNNKKKSRFFVRQIRLLGGYGRESPTYCRINTVKYHHHKDGHSRASVCSDSSGFLLMTAC